VDEEGNALTYDGSSWSVPVNINGSQGENWLNSVSCPKTSFCVAVGADGTVLTYKGSSWSAASIDGTSNGVGAVSCVSSKFCAAVGYRATTYNGRFWSARTGADGWITSVSCPSSSFCAAVDSEGKALTYNGSAWSAPVSIDGTNRFFSISCPSASFCAAGDEEGNALTYNGSAWSAPVSIDTNWLNSISCPSESFCMAMDGQGNALTYSGDLPVTSDSGGSPVTSGAPAGVPKPQSAAGRVRIGHVSARGTRARVPVKCTGPSGAICTVALSMRMRLGKAFPLRSVVHRTKSTKRTVTLGMKTARLKAGHRRLLRIALNATGNHLLTAHRELSARLQVTQAMKTGIAVIASQKVIFRERKP
jgi:hypothetical protein